MEKIINLLGGKKNGTERTGIFDIPTLLKMLGMALVAAVSLAYSAGLYMASAKDLPGRVEVIERKQDLSEARQEAILQKLDGLSVDLREVRAVMLSRGRDAR